MGVFALTTRLFEFLVFTTCKFEFDCRGVPVGVVGTGNSLIFKCEVAYDRLEWVNKLHKHGTTLMMMVPI